MKYKDSDLEEKFLGHYEKNILDPYSKFYFFFQSVIMIVFFIIMVIKVSTVESKQT